MDGGFVMKYTLTILASLFASGRLATHRSPCAPVALLTLCMLLLALAPGGGPAVQAAGEVGSGTPESCDEAALESALAGGGTITFNCGDAPHTITVSSPKYIGDGTAVTLDGGGLITLSGNNAVRVFEVERGNLTLQNLTVADGNAGSGDGGGIWSESGTLTLSGVTLSNNRAQVGGALYLNLSTTTIQNSTIANNSATEGGGGLHYYREGQSGGPLVISGSTFVGNSAANLGGAMRLTGSGGAGLQLTNSTFVDNQASNSGAIYHGELQSTITHTTFSGNSASEYVAGIFNSGGTLAIGNSIIANNLPTFEDLNCANEGGTMTNLGGNMQFPGDNCGTDIPVADPLLLPLGDNGGTTPTMALGAGSPAIDGGTADACAATDQRGVVRPADGTGDGAALCDSGAYELEAGTAPPSADNVVGDGTPASCTEAALRDAVARSGTITFNCGSSPHTIPISDDIRITQDTILDGGGTSQGGLITISGQDQTRVFAVDNHISFTVRNLTISNGKEPGEGRGSGINTGWRSTLTIENSIFEHNDGTAGDLERGGGAIATDSENSVVVRDSLFRNNRGINGGAINVVLSSLTVENSVFEHNDTTTGKPPLDGNGGAIYTDGASLRDDGATAGQITILDSVFRGNEASREGGAVFSWVYPPDQVIVERCEFRNNRALRLNGHEFSAGGGLRHGNGELFVRDTLFDSNYAAGQGGGLWGGGLPQSNLTNVTLVNNRAVENEQAGTGGLGGAIAGPDPLVCTNCTIARNHAGDMAGGIYVEGNVTLKNSIIAHNTAANGGSSESFAQNCNTNVTDSGNNLEFPKDMGGRDCTAGAMVADPLLGDLADYGGTMPSVALLGGSPAIDAGDDSACPATDLRGVERSIDGDGDGVAHCDIGAHEYRSTDAAQDRSLPIALYLPLLQR